MAIDLARVSAADFSGHVGTAFRVGPGAGPEASGLSLTLAEVEPAGGGGPRPGGAFSLVFAGPESPRLPQGSCLLSHPEMGEAEIFLVPIQPPPGASLYQAVFN